jgi:hypothetical protein
MLHKIELRNSRSNCNEFVELDGVTPDLSTFSVKLSRKLKFSLCIEQNVFIPLDF